MFTSRVSPKIEQWAASYLYASIKHLRGIKGNPSKERMFSNIFGYGQEMTLALIQTESITRKLLKAPPPERRALAKRYNIGENYPLECQELRDVLTTPITMWKKVKLALTKISKGVCKWWLDTRYQGHTRNHGVVKCTCLNNPTITQTHVVHCERFANCYLETAREKETTVDEIKNKLMERDFDRDTK